MKWAYGVTTVPSRFEDLLPRTLASLARAGFDKPRLFVDGAGELPSALAQYEVTRRDPVIRTYGNWVLAAWELYIRTPSADRYAVFQDDFVTYPNLRRYLDGCAYPKKGYWNLYTFPENEKQFQGWYQSNQLGKGAVALVFSGEALRFLLGQKYFIERPMDVARGHRVVDGGIVTAFKNAGWKEYVHNPSLVQHTGKQSSMGSGPQELANTFRGEEFDAAELLNPPVSDTRVPRRLGLVGYNAATGLGELNRQLASYGDIHTWLVRPHPKLPTLKPHENVDTIVCPLGHPTKIQKFVSSVDVVVFCESTYYDQLIPYCKAEGRRTVCVPMMEWMPPGARGWPQQVDLFICPTKQCYNLFSQVIPCVYFPWPVDTDRFQFRLRQKCERFLFVAGHGGWKGRKGIDVILRAKELWPEMPLVVHSQDKYAWPANIEVLPPPNENCDLYAQGDVLIAPHSVDGLGLEPMEAMSCGMPVITTDGEPWNEIPAIRRIPAQVTRRSVRRPVDWYLPNPAKLVELCKELLGTDIEKDSNLVRSWAEVRSWNKNTEKFAELVRYGKGVRADNG